MRAAAWSLLLLLGTAALGTTAEEIANTQEEELRSSLLQNYDKHARPQAKTTIKFTKLSILDVEMHEMTHRMSVLAWLGLQWDDSRLMWSKDKYKNLGEYIAVPPSQLWMPDLTIYNAGDPVHHLVKESEMMALVYSTGSILYIPSILLHFTCIADTTYWPHDVHNCSLKLGSWVFSGLAVDVILDPNVNFDDERNYRVREDGVNLTTSEWWVEHRSVVREAKKYDCCPETYVNLLINVAVRRDAQAYRWTVKTPTVCLALLTLVMFLLPPGAGEKVVFGGVCIAAQLILLAYMTSIISHSPTHTPLIVQMVATQTVVLTTAVLAAALVVRLARNPHVLPLPSSLRRPVATLAYLLCLNDYARMASGALGKPEEVKMGGESEDGDLGRRGAGERREAAHQWLLMAALLDRLALLLYLLIAIITFIRFSSVL